jgi:Lanthionine synthetase C-like protein
VLYRPEAFEPLSPEPWDEARVRAAIGEIVADADAAFDPDALWPAHDWDGWSTPLPLKNLYVGAAGVLWALHALRKRGVAVSRLDLEAAAARTLELRRGRPDLMQGVELPQPADASLLEGESGILAVLSLCWNNTSSDALLALVRANRDNPADELMWGAPGTILAAKALHDATGEERWAEAWRESAAAVLGRRDADGLWTQRLHGRASRGLGPIHGAVGNVRVLLDGGGLLPAETRALLARETAELLERTAVREDGLANWPDSAGDPLEAADGQVRLQWDVGAPGIVATAFDVLDEELLLAGAELTWRAGAHGADKGSGICHGTAGNGYALLKAFARTQDELWLDCARRFAVHALGQAAAARQERGRGRYSLWTGDVGVALFAADCVEARTRYPILETWS